MQSAVLVSSVTRGYPSRMGGQQQVRKPVIDRFDIKPGRVLARKYEVIKLLGRGWEGEVYLVREHRTNIERAVKVFYPQRNPGDKIANFYACKLHKLRHCPIAIQYHTHETIIYHRQPITLLVSDFVEGELLSGFIARQPGKRLPAFPALHLLHALASGIECIHQMKEYHGDLHSDNIMVQRYGLGFELKLLDFFHWGPPKRENIRDDVVDLVKLLHEAIGGSRYYSRQPPEIKAVCCGLKRSLILKKFRTAGQLREYLENMQWSRG
jgi:tRNA A-37 threonylcarbamoyl transferase component Bud32